MYSTNIAVPRNVQPSVAQIDNVFLYSIDDLTRVSKRNRKQRESEVQKAEEIVSAEVDKFMSWWQTFAVRPVISSLMSKAIAFRTLLAVP